MGKTVTFIDNKIKHDQIKNTQKEIKLDWP